MAEQQIAPPGWQGQWPPLYNGMEEVAGMAYEGSPPGYGIDKSPTPNEPQDGDSSNSKPPPVDYYQMMLDAEAQSSFNPKPLAYPPKAEAQNAFTSNQIPYCTKGESSVRHATLVAPTSNPAPMNVADWQLTFFTGDAGRSSNEGLYL
ncbi:hypothetical protein DVH05_001690 [Phytophthora capsici]|nr:hypothetical protein DVH05_001690 [Phytophthora capsici]